MEFYEEMTWNWSIDFFCLPEEDEQVNEFLENLAIPPPSVASLIHESLTSSSSLEGSFSEK